MNIKLKLLLQFLGSVVAAGVGIYVLNEPVRKKINVALTGDTRGHMSRICSDVGDAVDKFSSINFAESTPTITDYYFFDIQNPLEYLQGGDAEIVEKGPYMLRKYSINFDIKFKPSTITASADPDPYGAIEYKVSNAYVVLDRDSELSSSLEKNEDSSLSLSETKRTTVGTQGKRMPSHLSMTDSITTLSSAYLSVLKGASSELTLVLSLACTPTQIANIGNANPNGGAPQCSALERLDPEETACACCMLSDTYDFFTDVQGGSAPPYIKCNAFLNDSNAAMSTVSLLAYYDGGVAVKSSGDPKFDGSGNNFVATMFGQATFHTPLVQTHSVNDLMFGYPSAMIGRILAISIVGPVYRSVVASDPTKTKTDVAKEVLTGALDSSLPKKIGNLAKYTRDVGSVCSSTCSSVDSSSPLFVSPLGWMCEGTAPERHQISDINVVALGGIDCKPYSSTFSTKMYCQMVEGVLAANPSAAGFEACHCADGNDNWSDSGCCVAGGMLNGNDLTGFGCLSPIPGAVDANFLGQDTIDSTNLDLGRAIETYINKKDLKSSSVFMCPAEGKSLPEHKKFGYYEAYEEQTEFVSFYDTGYPRILPGDALDDDAIPYTSTVTGGTGKYMPPAGFNTIGGGPTLSIGYPANGTQYVFIGAAKRPFAFEWQHDHGLYPKSCGASVCLATSRFLQSEKNFMRLDGEHAETGQGLPYNGLQSLGHLSGIPVYLHQPFFMGGDDELYSQLNNSHVQSPSGNGIKVYHSANYTLYEDMTAPGEYVVGGVNSDYQRVDSDWVEEHRGSFETFLDVESATGITLESRIRFGVSYSIWECNPQLNPACVLALKSKGQAKCYKGFGEDYFQNLNSDVKSFLETHGQDNFTFPCSAANVFTPNVVAGKVVPTYWFSSNTTARPQDVDKLMAAGKTYASFHHIYVFLIIVAGYLHFWFLSTSSGGEGSNAAKTQPVS